MLCFVLPKEYHTLVLETARDHEKLIISYQSVVPHENKEVLGMGEQTWPPVHNQAPSLSKYK